MDRPLEWNLERGTPGLQPNRRDTAVGARHLPELRHGFQGRCGQSSAAGLLPGDARVENDHFRPQARQPLRRARSRWPAPTIPIRASTAILRSFQRVVRVIRFPIL